MGENNILPKEDSESKMNETPNGTSENPTDEEMDTNSQENSNDENDDNLEDMTPEEIAALDNQLDALNSALDDIEQKNDFIHSQLLELLHANREIRQQMQQDQNQIDHSSDDSKAN
ncbi:UPF0184 protein CG14818 [Diorhabda carinulata]|uniref:UPF0184 protein CG14818 n=1 Tax=Diorhabda sublineata TaxID=1163346 RepID=UPI0024E19833|nr:UPF0184 protein CG14818 [Diorhabda sublineata]XP_057659159.1 UPF0184 protein CG14818 [Diorhabda carinulata]